MRPPIKPLNTINKTLFSGTCSQLTPTGCEWMITHKGDTIGYMIITPSKERPGRKQAIIAPADTRPGGRILDGVDLLQLPPLHDIEEPCKGAIILR